MSLAEALIVGAVGFGALAVLKVIIEILHERRQRDYIGCMLETRDIRGAARECHDKGLGGYGA